MRDIYVIAPVVGKQLDFAHPKRATPATHASPGNAGQERTVAFLGQKGTFSHKACNQFFGGEVSAVSRPSFRAIFEAAKNGEARFGVLPLENSLTGSIHENYDLLLEYNLKIVGEVTLRIVHHLIGRPGTRIEQVNRVLSHPQGFQQCRLFLERHEGWELVSVTDTAWAVKQIQESGSPEDAAIGSEEEAKLQGMEIIEEGIETNPRNYTRFVIIGTDPLPRRPRTKSSLVYSTGNQAGALYETLKVFANNGINLVKLESRPIPGRPWEYMFYVDLEADLASPSLDPVLREIGEKTDFLKVLGSY